MPQKFPILKITFVVFTSLISSSNIHILISRARYCYIFYSPLCSLTFSSADNANP